MTNEDLMAQLFIMEQRLTEHIYMALAELTGKRVGFASWDGQINAEAAPLPKHNKKEV